MRLLLSYLRRYWKIVVLALVLAAINQIFSLLDPLIFRHIIDDYATKFREHSTREFFRGVGLLDRKSTRLNSSHSSPSRMPSSA